MILSRNTNRLATYLLFLGDATLIAVGFVLAWFLRFESGIIPLHKPYQPFSLYVIPVVVVTFIWIVAFAWQKLFEIEFSRAWGQELGKILKASIAALVVSMALTFIYRGESYSRLTLGLGVLLVFFFTGIFHRVVIVILRGMLRKGRGVSRKLVIGDGALAELAVAQILADPLTNRGLVGRLCTEESPNRIGAPSQLKAILIDEDVDVVILAEPEISEAAVRRMIYECRKEKALFVMVPVFQGLLKGLIEIDTLGDLGSLVFRDVAMTSWERYAKRAIDLTGSGLGLLVLSPFFTAVSIAIKLNSKGPVFFAQERIGKNGRKFKMLKFRSMYMDAEERFKDLEEKNEAEGALFKLRDDPRVTKVGRLLRRFSIDEMPQLINVFLGQMSLVGPRPPLERELSEYESWQLKRVDTIPGMTGLWQVSGRSDLPFSEMVRMDIYYIEHWSIWLDLKILFKTIPAVLSGKGAY